MNMFCVYNFDLHTQAYIIQGVINFRGVPEKY